MGNNNYLSLINFKIKTSSSETFLKKMNTIFNVQNFLNVANMVSRAVLKRVIANVQKNLNIQRLVH